MNKIRKFFHLREKKLVVIRRVHLVSAMSAGIFSGGYNLHYEKNTRGGN